MRSVVTSICIGAALVLSTVQPALAQNSQWGEKIDIEGNALPELILGSVEGSPIIAFKSGRNNWTVSVHTAELSKSGELNLNLGKEEPNLEHHISGGGVVGNHPYILVKSVDDKMRKSLARILWLDTDLSGYKLQEIGKMYIESRRNSGIVHGSVSPDGQNLAVVLEPPMERGEPWIWQTHVFGPEKEKVWTKNFTVNPSGKPGHAFLMEMNNTGQVHILKSFRKDQDFRFLHYTIDKDLGHHKQSELEVPGLKITDVKLAVMPDNRIVIGGLTTSSGYYDQADGWFTVVTDKMGNQNHIKYEQLSNPANRGMTTLLSYLLVMSDGRPVLVAEHYSENTEKARGRDGYDYLYTYGDAYSIWPDIDGSNHGYFEISKEQKSVNDASLFSSHEAFISEGVFHLIYNETDVQGRKNEMEYGATRYYILSGPKPESGLRSLEQKENMMIVPGFAKNSGKYVYLIAMNPNRTAYSIVQIKSALK